MTAKVAGGVILYYFAAGEWRSDYADCNSLVWTGLGPQVRGDRYWAYYLSRYADVLKSRGETEKALQFLLRAVALYEDMPNGMNRVAAWYSELGNKSKAEVWSNKFRRQQVDLTPRHLARVDFGDEIRFDGITLPEMPVAAGSTVDIAYFWHCSDKVSAQDWAVFVHFVDRDGKVVFQDDHVLLEGESIVDQPWAVQFKEQRQLHIPAELPAGNYRIRIGVYARTGNHKRLPAKGKFGNIRRYAELPVEIIIGI
jgi:hypothetical protein